MKLLSQNAKMKKSIEYQGVNYDVYNFGITAYFDPRLNLKTCPLAGTCGKQAGCYAKQGTYIWPQVANAYHERTKATLADNFVTLMIQEIEKKQLKAWKKGHTLVIRIHDSGDFYSTKYLKKWIQIMEHFGNTVYFYAYTKSIPMFLNTSIPDNFTVIFSEGGKADKAIGAHRHARVFESEQELKRWGYQNAMNNDLVAAFAPERQIGLVYHGAKSRKWETNTKVYD